MSYYAAILLPPEVRHDLHLASGFLSENPPSGLVVAPADDWHITLAFLGDRPESVMPEVHRTMAWLAVNCAPLVLQVAGAGQFGDAVLWAGVEGELDRLSALAVRARHLLNANVEFPFSPHVTLAKTTDTAVDLGPWVARLGSYEGPRWQVSRLHVMCSGEGEGWVPDVSVASWPLTGRA